MRSNGHPLIRVNGFDAADGLTALHLDRTDSTSGNEGYSGGRQREQPFVPDVECESAVFDDHIRIQDRDLTWRVSYRVDVDAVIIAEVSAKKTQATPQNVIDVCKRRLRKFDEAAKEKSGRAQSEPVWKLTDGGSVQRLNSWN